MKKIFCLLLCVAMITMFPSLAEASENNGVEVSAIGGGESTIMPLWSYTQDVTLSLGFKENTAYCALMIIGGSSASGIKANMWLYQANDDGSWTLLDGWRNMTADVSAYGVEKTYSPVYKGQTYKLYFTGKCYGPNGVYYDPLAAETIITY